MKLYSLLSLLSLSTTALTSTLTITIPPSSLLPNPNILPANTHATLTSAKKTQLTAPLTRTSTFIFRDLHRQQQAEEAQTESYLLDIRSPEYVFAPYRVDVAADGSIIGIWETFRGNPWDNKGVEKFSSSSSSSSSSSTAGTSENGDNVSVEARVVSRKGFYEIRQKFSPLTLFKNPMILLAVVALAFTFGMPKLMENMDPEMRAEFEKQSRSSPLGATQSAMAGGGGPGNFDLAGWMAGAQSRGSGAPGAAMSAVEGVAARSGAGAGTSGRENRGATRRRG